MKDYESFFEDALVPELRRLEVRRRRRLRAMAMLAVAAFAAAAVLVFHETLAAVTALGEDLVILGALLVAVGATAVIFQLKSRTRREIKTALVAPTCRFLGLDYSATAHDFPLAHFTAAGLLPDHDSARLEDHIRGTHEQVSFQLCEGLLKKRVQRTDGKGHTRSEQQVVFQGLLLIYRFPKPFGGRTLVLPDRGWLGNKLAGHRYGERVRLEDPRFEELYEVFSDDQVEARYLLTPGFMERLTALADQLGAGRALSFGFLDQDLLIVFKSGRAHFEGGSLFAPLDRPERARALLEELRLIHQLIEQLDLANRSGL